MDRRNFLRLFGTAAAATAAAPALVNLTDTAPEPVAKAEPAPRPTFNSSFAFHPFTASTSCAVGPIMSYDYDTVTMVGGPVDGRTIKRPRGANTINFPVITPSHKFVGHQYDALTGEYIGELS